MEKKKIVLSIVMLFLLIIITVGVTFAAFTFSQEGQVENTLETSTIVLTYTEGKTGITLNETYPMSDDKGKVLIGENNVFDFTVQTNLGKNAVISYEVTAVKIPIEETSTLKALQDNEVKLYLERAIDPDTAYQQVLVPSHFIPIKDQTEVGSPSGSMILDSGTFFEEGITIHNYRLRMWVDENTEIPSGESRKYGVKVNVYAKQTLYNTTDKANFTFDSSTGTITDYNSDGPKDVVIPYTIDGVKVTTIGDNAFSRKQLTSVVIPDSVTTIGNSAFYVNQLTSVKIPDSVTMIQNSAFGANRLTSVEIPNGVTTIGVNAFYSNSLTSVEIPNSVITIEGYAFSHNQLTSVEIPNSVTTIGNQAFYQNQLTSVTIGNNVTTIGAQTFGTNQLTSVEIPNSVTTIEALAFENNQLTSVTIPDSVTEIGNYAFQNNQLTSVIIGDNVTAIRNGAFTKSSNSNPNLVKIVNKTGKSFDWKSITGGSSAATFVTGTIIHSVGDIIVTDPE